MKLTLQLLALLLLFLSISCNKTVTSEQITTSEKLTSYVDPFIGTAEHGHVYPGATLPFGMVQLSPDNGTQGWDWCSGYNWADDTIVGFSHTHLSGTGIGDLCDISFMPALNSIDFTNPTAPRASTYAAKFSHKNESASPGFYSVTLDNQITVDLSTSERVGFHQYSFPKKDSNIVLIDLSFAINWDQPIETNLTINREEQLVTGYRLSKGWAKDQRVYFAAKFSEAFQTFQIADSTAILNASSAVGRQLKTQLTFQNTDQVKIKVGISSANIEGALAALEEIPDWDFEKTKQKADELWEKELGKIQVESPNDTLKKIFYTSLYRTCLAPVKMTDALGNYKGVDGAIHQSAGYEKYGIFSLWDTFRAANPLFTLIQPDRINDFIRSMLAHYDQYGLLPVWSLLGNETNTMTGYHAIPVIVDAYLKGYRDYDVEKVYEALKTSAMQDIRATDHYRNYGYIPYDKSGQSVTRTLEYAFDDWCIAQMAKALDKEEDYQLFTQRANSYEALFDDSTGFLRAKYSNGEWKTPFDPQYSSHDFHKAEYTEGNAWQHSWFVPHAPERLIELHGGKEAFTKKLDSLFTIDSEIRGENASVDISGLIGQYAHGNEPSHHIGYFYHFADQAPKTQAIIREIMDSQYSIEPNGLCGNEDCGQMSAWYVFSAMGIYPFNPASGKYVFGSPVFDKVEIPLPNGKTFQIIAHNVSFENKYVRSVKWNGEAYDKFYISHEDIMKGGVLEFEMQETAE